MIFSAVKRAQLRSAQMMYRVSLFASGIITAVPPDTIESNPHRRTNEMARLKCVSLLAGIRMAGCSSGHPGPALPVHSQQESPESIGRNCVTTINPDGTPDYSNG